MEKKDYKFQKLTPIQDVKMGIYENALDFVFANEDIRNVAVSGSYGAGKSSMIETYKKAHPEMKFLSISLAHFEEEQQKEKQDEKAGEVSDKKDEEPSAELYNESKQIESLLEGKILNQLIHQIDPDRIPQTNFRIKRAWNRETLWGYTWWGIGFIILLSFLTLHGKWCELVEGLSGANRNKYLEFTTSQDAVLLAGMFFLAMLMQAIFFLLKTQKEKKFLKKISVQGNDIEIFEESADSYFDKYLNEVIYLFENSGADAIVFEDMDRFNTNQIFEKLREINTLIAKRSMKPLRFIYLLRDDIFVSKDRTKFFDFIIPIVPVVDGSNSYDKFLDVFKEGGIDTLFSGDFLQGLSLYVDDMRILKNIYNEFMVYYNRLAMEKVELNPDKLLAMVVYKNIFPRDFGELQLQRGYVHALFWKKEKYRADEVKKLQSQIAEYREKIKMLKDEISNDIDELQAIYFTVDERISVGNKEETDFAKKSDFIKAVKEASYKVLKYDSYYGRWKDFDATSHFRKIDQNKSYLDRKQRLEQKEADGVRKSENQIRLLEEKSLELQSAYLKDIINRENADEIFKASYVNELNEEDTFKVVRRSPYFPLIRYLIKNGYIDETYPDYMTYFYPNSISSEDKNFLRSITDEKAKEYSYPIKNPELIISWLREVDFDAEEVLNFGLLDYLLEHAKEYEKQLNRFFNLIYNMQPEKFVLQYVIRNKNVGAFAKRLNERWPGAVSWILSTDILLPARKKYVVETLCNSCDSVIAACDTENCISDFVENDTTFLALDDVNVPLLIEGFAVLGIKFKEIDYSSANQELLSEVYKMDMYELNLVNIEMILRNIYGISEEELKRERMMTLIFAQGDLPLAEYAEIHLDKCINIVLQVTEYVVDSEDIVLFILNKEDVAVETKEKYIARQQTLIGELEKVETKDIWGKLLENNKVLASPKNVFTYYYESGEELDEYLVDFMNRNLVDLKSGIEYLKVKYTEEAQRDLRNAFLRCNALEDQVYENTMKAFGMKYSGLSSTNIQIRKMEILIKNHIVIMNADTLEFMRASYSDCVLLFIKKNLPNYVETITEENYLRSELLELLDDHVNDKTALALLEFEMNPVSIRGKQYSKAVICHILDRNLDEKDIPYLIENYPMGQEEIDSRISRIAKTYIADIAEAKYQVSEVLLDIITKDTTLWGEDRGRVLAWNLSKVDRSKAKEYLGLLKLTEYLEMLEGKRPLVEMTAFNESMLMAFKRKGWVTSFDEDAKEEGMYRAYGKKEKTRK